MIKKYIEDLATEIEKGNDVQRHRAILITLLTEAVDKDGSLQEFAENMDMRLNLHIFC